MAKLQRKEKLGRWLCFALVPHEEGTVMRRGYEWSVVTLELALALV